MKDYNKKKNEQLGMSHGTAANRLRKAIMFRLLQDAGKDMCFQCGEKIESVDEISIEHKVPWLDNDDPVGLFFDLDNIAFSHLSCNVGASRQHKGLRLTTKHGSKTMYSNHGCRCRICTKAETARVAAWRIKVGGRKKR